MDRRLEVALAAARAGGEVALRYFRTGLVVETKADLTPVTRADREAEERIAAVVRQAFPDHGVVGEEFGVQAEGPARWIIDPIDGTKNFVRGIPYFATLIALEEEGEITTGVMHAPAVGETLYAQKGQGAFDNAGPLHVSRISTLSEAMLVFGGLDLFRRTGRWAGVERLVEASARQRGFGDYFGHTFVARGQAEAMVEAAVAPWDIAPVKVIVEEAGGRFTDLDGHATIYGGHALASNGRVHDEIVDLLRHGRP